MPFIILNSFQKKFIITKQKYKIFKKFRQSKEHFQIIKKQLEYPNNIRLHSQHLILLFVQYINLQIFTSIGFNLNLIESYNFKSPKQLKILKSPTKHIQKLALTLITNNTKMIKDDQIDQLLQLEQQQQQLDKQLSLQEQQALLIKDYSMNQGNYKIIVTVYQLNDLQPKSLKLWKIQLDEKTACDPFLQIVIGEQAKKTQIKKQTNNPIFDQQFYFQFPKMTVQALDKSKITFNVYDTKLRGISKSLIGSFQLDWTNVYFKRNHQIYRAWFTLYDPNQQIEGPVGYVLANIAVLGQNDQITIHDSAYIKDPLVTIQDTITSPKIRLIECSIAIQIYRAQHLIPIDSMSSQINAYLIAKFSGNKIKTSNKKSLNPEWNQILTLGTQVPNKSKYITLEVRNKNFVTNDDIVGVIKIPFADIFSQKHQPKWGHLYGPPIAGKDVQPYNHATKMQVYGDKIGSHYRGRLLYKIIGKKDTYTKNTKNKLIFKFPYSVIPVIPNKLFKLRIDLIQGFGLPEIKECFIQICLGEYTLKSQKFQVKNGFSDFYKLLEDKKVDLPQYPQSMPDLVIYLCNGVKQQNRIGYLRIKASQIYNNDPSFDQVKVYQLKFDKSINSKQLKISSGFVACKIQLFIPNVNFERRFQIKKDFKTKSKFDLKVFLYRGQGFPPANSQGDCDPKIKFSFDGVKFQSGAKKSTYNPIWNKVIPEQVQIQDLFSVNMEKCLICDVYDDEQDGNDNYIGSFNLKINGMMRKKFKLPEQYKYKQIDFIYSKPKWHYVTNSNVQIGNSMFGRVLISCCLFKRNYFVNNTKVSFGKNCTLFDKIMTETHKKNINFFVIGIRDLKLDKEEGIFNSIKRLAQPKLKQVIIKPVIKISSAGEEIDIEKSFNCRFKSHGCQINQICRFRQVEIPLNKSINTFIEFKIFKINGSQQYVYGYNAVNLNSFRNIFADQQSDEKAKRQNTLNILNVQKLQNQLKMLKVINKIRQQNKKQVQSGNFIQKKRIKAANQQNLIAPNQIQLLVDQFQDPQQGIYLDRMLIQLERELKSTSNQDYAYVLAYQNNISNTSSNNCLNNENNENNKNQRTFNLIDTQNQLFQINQRQFGDVYNENNENDQSYANVQIKEQHDYDILDSCNNIEEDDQLIQNHAFQQNIDNKYQEQAILSSTRNNQKPLVRHTSSHYQDQIDCEGSSKALIRDTQRNYTRGDTGFNSYTKDQFRQKTDNFRISVLNENLNTKSQFNTGKSFKVPHKAGYQPLIHKQKRQKKESDAISNFNLNESLSIEQIEYHEKAIKFHEVQKGLMLQKEHFKQALEKQQEYKYLSAVKLSLFKWVKTQPQTLRQTYQDYDTDEQQNLDIIPEWYKGRKLLLNDLQNILENSRTIESIPIYRGRKIQGLQARVKQKIGNVKLVVMSGSDETEIQNTVKYYQGLLRPKQFSCRIYVLKGKSLLTDNLQKPDTYLRFTYGQKATEYKQFMKKSQNNPEYYLCHQEWIKLPGPSTVRIQVVKANYLVGKVGDSMSKDTLIGYTEVDMQDRYFMKKWHLLEKKPIQLRNLYSQYGIGTQGRLQTWVDLIQKKKITVQPIIKITPPPFDQYQLRVIVWSTRDCVFKNQQLQSNDIFVRGQIGKGNYQQTDVHWACRSVGNFNWRFKFPVFYPPKPQDMYSDVFIVQIWDKDVIGYNNLIGQTKINLNSMHKLIQKAVKRKKPVSASKKIIEKNMRLTDKFWFDVYNHRQKDQFGQLQSQGKVRLSFELVPMELSKTQRVNGYGRSDPNVYPCLQDPAGRLSFDVLNPLDFLKQLLGQNLYKKICIKFFCFLAIVIFILLMVFFGTSIVGGLVARG